jgi:hypothetical protein
MAFKMKGYSPFTKSIDPPNGKKKKPIDDDTDKMTKKQERQHMKKILEYNRNVAKPHPNQKGLKRKLELASRETRAQIDKLQDKGSLNADERAKLKDLKATYKDHQKMLHDMRRSPMKAHIIPSLSGTIFDPKDEPHETRYARDMSYAKRYDKKQARQKRRNQKERRY